MIPSTKFALAIASTISALLLATPSRVHAFGGPPGGPFGNGSNFPNDGTFSAVVRGTNLSGTLQFSTTASSGPAGTGGTAAAGGANATAAGAGAAAGGGTTAAGGVGSTGVANIYYSGSTFTGNSQGTYNASDSGMEVTFQAEAAGQGSGEIVVLRRYVSTSTTNGTTTTTQETLPVSTLTYFDSKTLNGYANCKASNSFPNQKFKGTGEVVVQELDFNAGNSDPEVVTSEPLEIAVTGVRLSNTASSFQSQTITAPSVVNTTILTNP